MMRPKVQAPVRVGLFTVYSDVEFTIPLPCLVRCSQVDAAHLGSTSDIVVSADPAVRYVVATVAIEV